MGDPYFASAKRSDPELGRGDGEQSLLAVFKEFAVYCRQKALIPFTSG